VQPIVDRIADQLPGWKADLLTKPGRKVLIQFVLTDMLIYLAMAIDLPAWALKLIDKFKCEFFWRGHKEVKGGLWQVAWGKVCRPLELGGLGISSLKELGGHFEWGGYGYKKVAKTYPNRPWSALPIHVPNKVKDFFSMAMQARVGDGTSTLF
jgi:hypothetical protein